MPENLAPYGWRVPDLLGNDTFKSGWTAIRNLAADISASLKTVDDRTAVGTWTDLPLAAGWAASNSGNATEGGGVRLDEIPQYRIEGRRVFLRGWVTTTAAKAASAPLLSTPLPAAARPTGRAQTMWGHWESAPTVVRMEIGTNGMIYLNSPPMAINTWVNLAGISWSLGT